MDISHEISNDISHYTQQQWSVLPHTSVKILPSVGYLHSDHFAFHLVNLTLSSALSEAVSEHRHGCSGGTINHVPNPTLVKSWFISLVRNPSECLRWVAVLATSLTPLVFAAPIHGIEVRQFGCRLLARVCLGWLQNPPLDVGGGNSVCLYDLNPHCCYSALIILPQQNIEDPELHTNTS